MPQALIFLSGNKGPQRTRMLSSSQADLHVEVDLRFLSEGGGSRAS
jgi:hypothetical protein